MSVQHVQSTAKSVVRILFILVNNLYCIPTYLLWMLSLRPLLYVNASLYWKIEGTLFRWLLLMVSNWLWMAGYYIAEMGDDIQECWNQESLMMVNHQSTGDVFSLMASLQNKDATCDSVCWIMDYVFRYTNFGWVSMLHGDFFIKQGKAHRDQQLERLQRHMTDIYLPRGRQWIILFPEGGFLRKRLANSQKFAMKNNYPVLNHVTLPRGGAMHTILKTVGPPTQNGNGPTARAPARRSLKWVIDITIGYPEKRPLDIFQVALGNRQSFTTVFYYRKYPITDIPIEEEGMLKWMYDRFSEKEALLEEFYKSGKFPTDQKNHGTHSIPIVVEPKLVELVDWWVWTVHIAFILSSYFHYRLLSSGWCYAMSWFM